MRDVFSGTKVTAVFLVTMLALSLAGCSTNREARKKAEIDELQKKFAWWPTDAKPAPVKDEKRGGYWWWPTKPGQTKVWGNRGYVYVYKVIFDYKADELPPVQAKEMRPSLLIKKIVKNVKVYFDFDKAKLRDDAAPVLEEAVAALNKSPDTTILIQGNCDVRGSESYNERLGRKRADAVKKYMIDNGIPEERIKIVSRGKLDAVAPVTDLVGMAKDRNAQFMVAVVEEVMLPAPESAGKAPEGQQALEPVPPEVQIPEEATKVEEGKYLTETTEKLESPIKVETREYTVKKGDSLSKIAQQQMGGAHRWKYLYELNKDRIKDPNKLKVGMKLVIPVE